MNQVEHPHKDKRKSWLFDPKKDLRLAIRMGIICAAALVLQVAFFHTGLFHELRARANPQQALPPLSVRAHWVALPESSFVDIGKLPDGSFSVDRLLLAWQKAGMTPRQGAQVVQQMQDHFTPVAMGVDDPLMEEEIAKRAALVTRQWELRWPTLNSKLAAMRTANWSTNETLETENMGQWRMVYEMMRAPRSQLPRLTQFNLSNNSMEQSKDVLLEAVGRAGLRSLRVWYADMETPLQVQAAAQGLLLAEEEMQAITGWSSGVLGLYGRVALDLATPINPNDGGMTHDQEGRYITIQGHWDAISHEWLHGLDIALGRVAFTHTGRDTLSSNSGILRGEMNSRLVDAWSTAQAKIIYQQDDWERRRWSYAIKHMDIYWLSSSEAMAYAFAEYSMRFKPEALDSSWVYDMPQLRALVPSKEEANQQATAWKEVLAQVRPLIEPHAQHRVGQ